MWVTCAVWVCVPPTVTWVSVAVSRALVVSSEQVTVPLT